MNVLMVVAEFSPLAKVGGLADAAAGLCRALAERGHDVRVLIPRYAHLPPADTTHTEIRSPDGKYRFLALDQQNSVPHIYLLDLPELAHVEGIYAGDERDALRFISLSLAAAALGPALHWAPDVIHCHDWHAALVPLAVARSPRGHAFLNGRTNTILTLHNIGYQGVFHRRVLSEFGFDELATGIETGPGDTDINLLRTGVATADALTTVSPTYAQEIQTPEFGMGLEDLMVARRSVLSGRLNGVDYTVWDPCHDPYIETPFNAHDRRGKSRIKESLLAQLGLDPDSKNPVVGIVSRLAHQKGIDLVIDALPILIEETNASFAILGDGDAPIERGIRQLATTYPTRIGFMNGYDEALAHHIIAGSDLFLVPSRYEPCGLTQLYALRYGTIPVVRETGGLADSIEPFDPIGRIGTGGVFRDADAGSLIQALKEALEWYSQPGLWASLMANAMSADFSWQARVPDYETLYLKVASS
jgi:starch synthase